MREKIHMHLLILCGIFCRGILGTLPGKYISESSDFLVRKRRVINHEAGGDDAVKISAVPYLVNIRLETETGHCAGAVLSHYTMITAASCMSQHFSYYEILSSSAYAHRSTVHRITSVVSHYGNAPHRTFDGISLLTVDPPFSFNRSTKSIQLHVGELPTGTLCTVSGWGCRHPVLEPLQVTRRLRSMTIPIMEHGVCENIYRNTFPITYKHICTYDPIKGCALKDIGTPLVVNGKLAGIHTWKGENAHQRNPDVYVNVQLPEYHNWIVQNTLLM